MLRAWILLFGTLLLWSMTSADWQVGSATAAFVELGRVQQSGISSHAWAELERSDAAASDTAAAHSATLSPYGAANFAADFIDFPSEAEPQPEPAHARPSPASHTTRESSKPPGSLRRTAPRGPNSRALLALLALARARAHEGDAWRGARA